MVTVQNNFARSRFDICDNGVEVGFVQYELRDGRMRFISTEPAPGFRDRGYAASYLGGILDEMHHRRMEVMSYCPVVRTFIFGHPEHIDLVLDDQLRRFGLSKDPVPAMGSHPDMLSD